MASRYKDSPSVPIPQAPTDVLRDLLHTMIQETLARESPPRAKRDRAMRDVTS